MLSPLGSFIMLKQEIEESKSGIVVQTEDGEGIRKPKGEVIAFGNDGEVEKLGLKVGDKVYFIEGSGEPLKDEDVEYLLVRPYDLIAVVR